MALGGTVTELQARMPIGEFHLWLAYRRKYGPMNPVRKYDSGPALISSTLANVHGNKTKPKDFMPYGVKDSSDEPSLEQFINALGAGIGNGKRR